MVRIVLIFALIVAGCATTEVQTKLPCPLFPELLPISIEQQLDMDPTVLLIVIDNQLAMKETIKQLRFRLGCDTLWGQRGEKINVRQADWPNC